MGIHRRNEITGKMDMYRIWTDLDDTTISHKMFCAVIIYEGTVVLRENILK